MIQTRQQFGAGTAGTHQPSRRSMLQQLTRQFKHDPLPPRPWGSNVIQIQPIQYYRPHDKQVLALKAPSGEIFFGGAKGGGKSLCLLLAFAAQERAYGRRARGIIFRRTQPEFADLRTKASELFRGLAEWKGKDMTWVFKSGATLRMAHLDTVQDVGRYTGQEYTFIGFDELTEWASGDAYSFMKTCLRNIHGVPGLIMSSGNPGRPGHSWVKHRFIDPMPPMRVFHGKQMPRVFIPARLDDNPHLMRDASYERTLREQENPILVDALRWGKWDVMVGQAFPEWGDNSHTYDPRDHYFDLKPEWPKWAACDWGQAKPYSIGYYCGMPNGRIVRYHESYGCDEEGSNIGTNEAPNLVAEREYNAHPDVNMMVVDTSINAPSTMGAGAETIRQMFERAGWVCINAIKDRIAGKRAIHRWLRTRLADGLPMFMVSRSCPNFIRIMPSLIYNTRTKGKEEDVDDSGEDHPYDEGRYSAMSPMASSVAALADTAGWVRRESGILTRAKNSGLGYDPNSLEDVRLTDSASYDPNGLDNDDMSWSRYL